MVDLSINVAGVKFDNPLFAASGQATNFGAKIKKIGLEGKPGGVFTKSVSVDTAQKWGRGAKQPTPLCWPWIAGKGRLGMNVICAKGEPYTCDDWFETEMEVGLQGGVPIIPSVSGSHNLAEWAYLAPNFEQAGAAMLELNFGTPHAGPWEHGAVHFYSGRGVEILRYVKKLVKVPLIIKLPYMSNGPELVKCAKQLVDAGADAFKVCMPAQGMTIDIETGIPPMGLASRSGILPGPPHKPLAIYNVFTLAEAIKIPIIGSGGVCDGKDVIEYMMAGASGVEICTWMMIKGPKLFHQINREIKEWMQAKGHRKLEDFRGVSLQYAGIEEYHDNPYSAVVDKQKCTGCGQCETVCTWMCQPTLPAAIQVDKKSKKAVVNLEKCIGCGYCFSHCPASAVTLKDWGKRPILKGKAGVQASSRRKQA